MSGEKVLFDSNVVIYLSKRELSRDYIDQFDDIRISVITYMEILGFRFRSEQEENLVNELVGLFETVFISPAIADKVIEIRKNYTIKLPDAIIAATAICENLSLVTRNISDFRDIGVSLIDPFS